MWEPSSQDFTLVLTFDPALGGARSYGPPSFSPVPLPGIAPPADLPLTTNRFTAHGTFAENPFGASNLFASATESRIDQSADWDYFSHTRLISNIPPGGVVPDFTAATFPDHLVLGSPFNFDYGTTLFETRPAIRLVGDLQYRGFASLVDVSVADPIPEPATLALVGCGLLLLARSRGRLRRASPVNS